MSGSHRVGEHRCVRMPLRRSSARTRRCWATRCVETARQPASEASAETNTMRSHSSMRWASASTTRAAACVDDMLWGGSTGTRPRRGADGPSDAPPTSVRPIYSSGMPSSTVPSTIASPPSLEPGPVGSLRCDPSWRSGNCPRIIAQLVRPRPTGRPPVAKGGRVLDEVEGHPRADEHAAPIRYEGRSRTLIWSSSATNCR